ncbi:MAG: peptide-methionine (S)-S-oxide reductase [Thermoplasmata archaeon]|nr:MAG: peptide-methionine (S)-S-oxide reductase [Thermoplasmata archaeon]
MAATEKALFGAGCFWGVQASFNGVKGVLRTTAGYAGGTMKNPAYEDVRTGRTGHAEVVLVEFDPSVVTYSELVRHFFEIHDPTTPDRQGPDIGSQYRSTILYFDEEQRDAAVKIIGKLSAANIFDGGIVTRVEPAGEFYRAEEYHQNYLEKKGAASCRI